LSFVSGNEERNRIDRKGKGKVLEMNWKKNLKLFYESVSFACLLSMTYAFVVITYNGLTTGRYESIIMTNMYGEHYIELVAVVIAFVISLITINERIDKVIE